MNIQAINNQTSFKAMYKPDYKFSETQKILIKDIEDKLGDRAKERDYCITPDGDDRVALFEVWGAKKSIAKDKYIFEKSSLCAICDEYHPFNVKDLDDAYKMHKNMLGCLTGLLIFLAVAAAATVTGFFTTAVKEGRNKTEVLIQNNPIKDTLQKVGKDTLDLTKQLLKK